MTITLTREEAQRAADALDGYYITTDERKQLVKTLRARLAQPEPERCKHGVWSADHCYQCEAQPEPPCKTGSQCIGGKCPQCVVDEPEPVAWILMNGYLVRHENIHRFDAHDAVPLYASPPQRPWVGLTDEEIIPDGENVVLSYSGLIKFARAIEAKLKERNA